LQGLHWRRVAKFVGGNWSFYPRGYTHTFPRICKDIWPRVPRGLYKGISTRTKRVAAKSIAAIPAESIPFIGVAVLIADTGYELYAACETARDWDQLYVDVGMADEAQEDAMHSVCDPELPDAGDVWGQVIENMDQIYSQHPIDFFRTELCGFIAFLCGRGDSDQPACPVENTPITLTVRTVYYLWHQKPQI
jgi:hypothetical protein